MIKGLTAAYSVIFPTYLILCVLAYAAFGADTSSSLIDSLQPHVSGGVTVAIYVILIVNTLALGSVYTQVCFTLIDDILPRLRGNYDGKCHSFAQLFVRFLYVALCTFFAAAFPFFGYLSALAGAISFTPLTVSLVSTLVLTGVRNVST